MTRSLAVIVGGAMVIASAQAHAAIVDAHAEVAAALYAASATQAAFEKSADDRLRAQRVRIAALTAEVKSGDIRHRVEL
ncbi:MAG TPA: hypothetical protein VII63_09475, partial [Caulobacteraceae bacterium]